MRMHKLYPDYLRERLGLEVCESEHSFYLYKQLDETTVYIQDMYTAPEYRKTGNARRLFEELVEQLKKRGITKLVGSTVTDAANPELGVYAMFSVGFKITGTSENTIWYAKEIM